MSEPRPGTLLGLATDAGCENFTDGLNGRHDHPAPAGYCLTKENRSVLAHHGNERACWPCAMAALLGSAPGPIPERTP